MSNISLPWLVSVALLCSGASICCAFSPIASYMPLPSGLRLHRGLGASVRRMMGLTADEANHNPVHTAIIGAGPTGLATAIMLARRGWKDIHVFERLPPPPPPASKLWGDASRSYNLGIGGRGQRALRYLELMTQIDRYSAIMIGRKNWDKRTQVSSVRMSEKAYQTRVIQRDRVTSALLEETLRKYASAIHIHHNVECIGMILPRTPASKQTVGLQLKDALTNQCFERTACFVVGADGVKSKVREIMEQDTSALEALSGARLRSFKFEDKNPRVYKTISFRLPPGWSDKLNYSQPTKNGLTLEGLPSKEGMLLCVILFEPGNPIIERVKTAADARNMFDELFPEFAPHIPAAEYENFAWRNISRLPTFSFCGPVLHAGGVSVCIGDTVHSVKPYFGLGLNSALEDVRVLGECLNEVNDDLSKALPLFSQRRAKEARTLVNMQRVFDRTGVWGFATFVLPLILDTIFYRLMPKIFKPNTILFMGHEEYSFTEIARRKRIDRLLQLVSAAFAGSTFVALFKLILRIYSRVALRV